MTNEELNAAIAEKVMGYKHWPKETIGDDGVVIPGFNPVLDANDALKVVEALEKKGWNYCLRQWGVELDNQARTITVPFGEEVFNLPRAICEAALKAVSDE